MTEWNVPTMVGRMAWARKGHKNHLFVNVYDYWWVRVCDWCWGLPEEDITKQTDLTCKLCMAVKPRELK